MMADVFEKLRRGQKVDMRSSEYRAAIEELHRADSALYQLNHSAPRTESQEKAWENLFAGNAPHGVGYMTPLQIDFPQQVSFGNNIFINHHLTMMSLGGITIADNVQIGPNVTMVTDNHDLRHHQILQCKPINLQENAWIGANALILPGVTIGENAVVAAGAVVTRDVPANVVVAGTPAKVIRKLEE